MAKYTRKTKSAIVVSTPQIADVYLSCSWQGDQGQDVTWSLVDLLDHSQVRCVGDVRVSGDQDPHRIKRILSGCGGFVVVIPFRADSELKTSPYIWQELEIAGESGLPILLLVDDRVSLTVSSNDDMRRIGVDGQQKLLQVSARDDVVIGPLAFDANNPNCLEPYLDQIRGFVERTTRTSTKAAMPFVFLSTRLKKDFALAREAIASAIESAVGISCLWADSGRFSTSVIGIQDRARHLIKDSQFVVADLTFGPEAPNYDSPSRAHEVGMAEGFEKELCLTAQKPRRSPYFAASHIQMQFWDDERDLHRLVYDWAYSRRAQFGRQVYNWRLPEANSDHTPRLERSSFDYSPSRRYIAPNAHPLSTFERTIVAVGFALIALSLSLLAKDLLKFDDTFDFAAILGAVFTLVFASDISERIRQLLGRWAPLRWLVPATGLVLLVVWASLRFGS